MLNHVNTDIAVDVFEVLSELTDPEVLSSLTCCCTLCFAQTDVLIRAQLSPSHKCIVKDALN